MKDTIEREMAIEAIAYSIELCNKTLDSMTLGGRDRYAVEVERNSLLKLKDDFKYLPSAQPESKYTVEELKVFQHGISLRLLSLRSAQHWRYDEETEKRIDFLEQLYKKVREDINHERPD